MINCKEFIQHLDLAEALSHLPLEGEDPRAAGRGPEAEDLESICLTLSPIVEASLDKMCRSAMEELDRLGGSPVGEKPREAKTPF